MLFKKLFNTIILAFLCVPSVKAIIVEVTTTEGLVYSSTTSKGYDDLVNYLRSVHRINPDSGLGNYYQSCVDLTTLCCSNQGALVDPEFAIVAKHISNERSLRGNLNFNQNYNDMIMQRSYYQYNKEPDPDFTLSLLRGAYVGCLPIKRYYGKISQDTEIYVYGDYLHNTSHQLYMAHIKWPEERLHGQPIPQNRLALFAPCRVVSHDGYKLTVQVKDTSFLRAECHGGDSSGPVFVKVANTGNPLEDFQYIGVDSRPGGKTIGVVLTSEPNIANWINKLILSEALGMSEALRPFERMKLGENFYRWEENHIYSPRPETKIQKDKFVQQTSAFSKLGTLNQGVLVDSSWMLGTKENLQVGDFEERYQDQQTQYSIDKVIPVNTHPKALLDDQTLLLGHLRQPLPIAVLKRNQLSLDQSSPLFLVSNRPAQPPKSSYTFDSTYYQPLQKTFTGVFAYGVATIESEPDSLTGFTSLIQTPNEGAPKLRIYNDARNYLPGKALIKQAGNAAPIIYEKNSDFTVAGLLSSMDIEGDHVRGIILNQKLNDEINHLILSQSLQP